MATVGIPTLAQTLQTNILFANTSSFGLGIRTNEQLSLNLSTPKNRVISNVFISNDPLISLSDTNGNFAFTNVQWGNYFLTASDSSDTRWPVGVGTNVTGSVTLGSLVNQTANMPPNPATNYVSQSQLQSAISRISGGGGSTNGSVFWNTSSNSVGQRTATVLWVYPTPPYSSTNFPYSLITTN